MCRQAGSWLRRARVDPVLLKIKKKKQQKQRLCNEIINVPMDFGDARYFRWEPGARTELV